MTEYPRCPHFHTALSSEIHTIGPALEDDQFVTSRDHCPTPQLSNMIFLVPHLIQDLVRVLS